MKPAMRLTSLLLLVILLSACQPQADIELGYQPPYVPVRISVNSRGEVNAEASYEWVTAFGTFDIGGGVSVNTLRNKYSSNVLIVRVDDEATVYELKEGARFDISFDDNNTLYRKVAFHKETDGDFILELESVQVDAISQADESGSNSAAYWCDDLGGVNLQEGDDARVVYPKVNLRSSPEVPQTWDANIVVQIEEGVRVTIIGGPVCAHEGTWWQIRTEDGYTGWMREFISDGYLLR
ncbi:hypothetical protein MASR2M66_11150 [Chloroflexota bacterium]|nr:hypothetical protein [Anaerolineales bacterium]